MSSYNEYGEYDDSQYDDDEVEEDIQYINEEIRYKFNEAERRVYAFTGCVCGALSASPILFVLLLKDNFKLGFSIYLTVVVAYSFLFRVMHRLLFGQMLENNYQWGNRTFEVFEGNFLERLYRKRQLDDYTYDYYLDEFSREQNEEYVWEYRRYVRRTRKFTILFTLITLAPTLVYAISKVKGMI